MGSGAISQERANKGSGFVFHPAVVDNAVQLGPLLAPLGMPTRADGKKGGARVLAAVAGLLAAPAPERQAVWAAAEKLPLGPSGTLHISHWIVNDRGAGLAIRDLQVGA